jgi:uncharacterized protein (TIGR03086 family)
VWQRCHVDMYAALDRATARFGQALAAVRDDQWDLPSPNPGWSVRDLVNHVVGGNRRYVRLLSGAPTIEVEALRGLEHLGNDPLRAFLDTSAEMTAAFHQPDVLARTVHHRLGDRSGSDLLVMRVMRVPCTAGTSPGRSTATSMSMLCTLTPT